MAAGNHQAVVTNEKFGTLPVECPNGHQIYVVYFPTLDNYGFACAVCHIFGTATHYQKGRKDVILQVAVSRGAKIKAMDGDLSLFTEMKAEKISCTRQHQIGVMSVGMAGAGSDVDFGFFCDHCKLYALEVEHRGHILQIKEKRDGGILIV